MDLDQYKNSTLPLGRLHQLRSYKAHIEDLLESNYTHNQILEYLILNEVDCSIHSLGYFIRNHVHKQKEADSAAKPFSSSKAKTEHITSPIQKPNEDGIDKNNALALDKNFSNLNLDEFL